MNKPLIIPLRASAQTAVAGTTTGGGVEQMDSCAALTLVFDLSAIGLMTQAADTLDVYVDASHDGTRWFNIGRFLRITGVDSVYATGTLTSTGALTPGVHAESVITSDAAAPIFGENVVIGNRTYRYTDALIRAARQTLTVSGTPVELATVTIGSKTYRWRGAIGAAVAATGTLTVSGLPNDLGTMVIGGKTYRWRTDALGAGVAASKILTFTGNAVNTNTVTINNRVYTYVTALTEVKAISTLTLTPATNFTDGNSITIGARTYTFKEVLTGANQILIGASGSDSLDNLIAAINNAAGEGTTYGTGTTINAQVTAVAGALDTMDITAKSVGVASNSIATTELSGIASWTAGTMAGGVDAIINEIVVGGSAEASIDNTVAAATHGAGEGTTYSTGTLQPTGVTVTKSDTDKVVATASSVGYAGNSIAIDETLANATWAGGATALSGGIDAQAADDVFVNGSAENAIDNLVLAITGGAGAGTSYGTGTVAHTTVTAAKASPSTMTVTAITAGTAGNAIGTTTTATNCSFGAGTLAGGIDVAVANDVLIGINAEAGIDNLVLAITGGAGEGTNYATGTVAHTQVTAVKASASTMLSTALVAGTAGNSIATTTTMGNGSWGAGTLANGHAETANDVLIGISAAVALDNLKSAVNATAGAGTTYGTGTLVHADVIATDNADTTQKFIARTPGTAANTLATTTTSTHLSWPDTTLGGGTGTSNPGVAGETVTIGAKTYTWVDVLSETNGAAAIVNQVLYGGSVTVAFANLKKAVNAEAGEGTNYSTGTTANATANVTATDATTVDVSADTVGPDGNSVATTTTMANGAFGAVTLEGGTYGAGVVAKQSLTWSPAILEGSQPVNLASDISSTSGGIRQVGFGGWIRYRGVATGATSDFTYSVIAVAKK